MESQTLTVIQAARVLGIGRTVAYREIAAGNIPSIKIGGKVLVPKAAIDELLSTKRTATSLTDAAE